MPIHTTRFFFQNYNHVFYSFIRPVLCKGNYLRIDYENLLLQFQLQCTSAIKLDLFSTNETHQGMRGPCVRNVLLLLKAFRNQLCYCDCVPRVCCQSNLYSKLSCIIMNECQQFVVTGKVSRDLVIAWGGASSTGKCIVTVIFSKASPTRLGISSNTTKGYCKVNCFMIVLSFLTFTSIYKGAQKQIKHALLSVCQPAPLLSFPILFSLQQSLSPLFLTDFGDCPIQ